MSEKKGKSFKAFKTGMKGSVKIGVKPVKPKPLTQSDIDEAIRKFQEAGEAQEAKSPDACAVTEPRSYSIIRALETNKQSLNSNKQGEAYHLNMVTQTQSTITALSHQRQLLLKDLETELALVAAKY